MIGRVSDVQRRECGRPIEQTKARCSRISAVVWASYQAQCVQVWQLYNCLDYDRVEASVAAYRQHSQLLDGRRTIEHEAHELGAIRIIGVAVIWIVLIIIETSPACVDLVDGRHTSGNLQYPRVRNLLWGPFDRHFRMARQSWCFYWCFMSDQHALTPTDDALWEGD